MIYTYRRNQWTAQDWNEGREVESSETVVFFSQFLTMKKQKTAIL